MIAELLVFVHWLLMLTHGLFRPAHLVVGAMTLMLARAPRRYARVRDWILPLLFTTLVYDSQRVFADAIRGTIRVHEPYAFDQYWFGIRTASGLLTPNEWLQNHLSPLLDFLCGFAYIVFIPEFFVIAGVFLFLRGAQGRRLGKSMTWGFFWLNVVGYTTYYWYPAAPPWYVALHGFGPADLSVTANLAGCARFDQLVGVPIFKTWYGNAADVFGAIPSLHVAYPLLAVIYSFKMRSFRSWSIFFYLWVSFAAVYLNHHYLLDILWGSAYALLIGYRRELFMPAFSRLRRALSRSLRRIEPSSLSTRKKGS